MRVLLVERETLAGRRLIEQVEEAGSSVIGPARSSGEAFLLAAREHPDVAIINVDLERPEGGMRLAEQLEDKLHVLSVLVTVGSATSENELNVVEYKRSRDIVKEAWQRILQ